MKAAERYADGQATKEELVVAAGRALAAQWNDSYVLDDAGARAWTAGRMAEDTTAPEAFEAAFGLTAMKFPLAGYRLGGRDGEAILCDLLRCVFGNPFRPASLAPAWASWNDRTAVKLAQAIYDERAFDRLPILADALEEAGCADGDVLAHCRGPGPHVRGCWVVDLLLGKG